jgi:hypothetical protein
MYCGCSRCGRLPVSPREVPKPGRIGKIGRIGKLGKIEKIEKKDLLHFISIYCPPRADTLWPRKHREK